MIDKSHVLTRKFKGVFDKAFEYRQSKKIAHNQREFNLLPEEDVQTERTSCEIFAAAYKRWMERETRALLCSDGRRPQTRDLDCRRDPRGTQAEQRISQSGDRRWVTWEKRILDVIDRVSATTFFLTRVAFLIS